MEHLVYCDSKAKVLEKLLNGTKTLIIRGAAGRKLPYGRVFEGETLYFIENNGDGLIKAKGVVSSVINSEKMTEDESKKLVAEKQDELTLTPAQIQRWAGKKVLCLVGVKDVQPIETLNFDRKKNMDDWLIVEKIEHVLEGSEHEYKNIRIN
jgi:hypothetical protein